MARGIKANPNRKEVRNVKISVRLNEYEYERLMLCIDIIKYDGSVSSFVRDLVNDKTIDIETA